MRTDRCLLNIAAGHRCRMPAWTLVLGIVLSLSAPMAGAEEGVRWSYSGARGSEHWGELSPAFELCGKGEMQSPIDIRSAEPKAYVPLMLQYRSQPLQAVNDGNGVHLLVPPGSKLRIRGQPYDLVGVHFHVPGEHRIEGAGFAAEIQLEHRGARGERLIVAIPVQAGRRTNSMLRRIVERLPTRAGERVMANRLGINPLFLFPSRRDYYLYDGSLDTPPCSEPVRWIVMAHPLRVDVAQIQGLARATGPNARGIQPARGRPVFMAVRGH